MLFTIESINCKAVERQVLVTGDESGRHETTPANLIGIKEEKLAVMDVPEYCPLRKNVKTRDVGAFAVCEQCVNFDPVYHCGDSQLY